MTTTVTTKGQVTLPKKVRDAAGIQPGDKVEVRNTASGGIYIGKSGSEAAYLKRLQAIAKRYPIGGGTTDEIMRELRGDPADDYEK
ncbi:MULTISPECIES: AbrB/MazE/SpoVT family DNA-binding domain-containing protein [Rhodopseudomonas]|uniref:AbrB family transcriptional regulator n=1 Tax=Rhodopseudomonas palustris TaxID=1076 RepID=A0A0D7EDK8_RHOPL|nr:MULTISPECIES: AbrB/MazE/SpoVT family DNA-binding domain-containing protein [Rhodopseudomonas]KIZ38813.1 AbrB family transcriptional regulator [Rhodopseudomonas palustris]MDF3810889.1 AbrB/MazE/SpoVT family DNA-binding domain-containing protein [Rhodopseudomonas sp. BAL398]WOK18258.1 AbrB/MazE/SpoVT family DNA-binding domain-containing protein [Rhodopseudomonas sp. BAL398]